VHHGPKKVRIIEDSGNSDSQMGGTNSEMDGTRISAGVGGAGVGANGRKGCGKYH
jgi:hypothetical protein